MNELSNAKVGEFAGHFKGLQVQEKTIQQKSKNAYCYEYRMHLQTRLDPSAYELNMHMQINASGY